MVMQAPRNPQYVANQINPESGLAPTLVLRGHQPRRADCGRHREPLNRIESHALLLGLACEWSLSQNDGAPVHSEFIATSSRSRPLPRQIDDDPRRHAPDPSPLRSEEHTSELQSLMRTSYA